jgi:hypothetical protein
MSQLTSLALPEPGQRQLRQKIGWICHLVRFMSIAYAAWVLYLVVSFWSDEQRVVRAYSAALNANVAGGAPWQRLACFGIQLGCWLALLGVVIAVWRLFSGFLSGSILSVQASRRLMLVGALGIIATGASTLAEPLLPLIISAHLAHSPAWEFAHFLNPMSLLELTFCAILIALAHVFMTAAELAEENKGFV